MTQISSSSETAGRPSSRPLVALSGVQKHFGDLHVLKDIDLEVASGEVVVVLGPSGSGKSTLCRTINRLETIDDGEIRIDGQVLPTSGAGLAKLRSEVGMVFQSFNLFAHKTVLQNLTVAPIKVKGVPRKQAEAMGMELLERVGVADQADKLPAQLSGGQQQRVAIARALAMDPEILLLDEVTSALDPEIVGEVLGVLRHIAETTNITMLIVTHEMQFARDVSNRVLMFDGGHIIEEAEPEVMFSQPKQERTRQFLHAVLGEETHTKEYEEQHPEVKNHP